MENAYRYETEGGSDALVNSIRYVMGLKKRSLSLVGRGKPYAERYRDQELAACGSERYTKKSLGFFGHVTWQASGLSDCVKHRVARRVVGQELPIGSDFDRQLALQ